MSFNHAVRRTHLYLGLFLVPWTVLYAVSSIPFSHAQYFNDRDKAKGLPLWTQRVEIPYEAPVPEGNDLRPFAARIMADTGLKGAFGANRLPSGQVNVFVYSVWRSTQAKYFPERKTLVIEDRRFRWDQMLTGLHAKGGFEQESVLQRSWSVFIDVACLSLLLWVASGFYMWWKLGILRGWGWLCLFGGCGFFALLVWML